MADWGLKVSREGAETSSTDPRDHVLNSSYKTFKVQERQTTTLLLPNGGGMKIKTIPHSLGYAPFFFVMAEVNTGKWYNVTTLQSVQSDLAPGNAIYIGANADATNLYVDVVSYPNFGADFTLNISYYLAVDGLS